MIHPSPAGRTLCALVLLGTLASAQTSGGGQMPYLVCDEATRIADPKLPGGEVRFAFRLMPAGESANAVAEVRAGAALVKTLWSGALTGGAAATLVTWDGRDANDARCSTGAYTLRVSAPGLDEVNRPVNLVRLGVTEIEAQDSPAAGADEFQMVYFRKGAEQAFYATPATHEYASELDDANGDPLAPVAVHEDTQSPVLDGSSYATVGYNYPFAYTMGTSPRLELTFGEEAVSASGTPMDVGYEVSGFEIRLTCDQGAMVPGADLVTPGGTALVDLPALPLEVDRADLALTLRWQFRATGESAWSDVPGAVTVPLRAYTLLGAPEFEEEGVGTQYAGPWVHVAQDFAEWKDVLGLPTDDRKALIEVAVKGLFDHEELFYDVPGFGMGSFFDRDEHEMSLSSLLETTPGVKYVNCSDTMGAATTMLSMMGAEEIRPVYLWNNSDVINLRVIRPIGASEYTNDVWEEYSSPLPHAFNFHHVFTEAGSRISDACLQVDVDVDPDSLGGTPGWNVRRLWLGTYGYKTLLATNGVAMEIQALPGIL